jgi:transcription elongation factor Elf1
MKLERVSTGPMGFEQRSFECPKCDHVEISVIALDPLKSKAAGWLTGELRTPN